MRLANDFEMRSNSADLPSRANIWRRAVSRSNRSSRRGGSRTKLRAQPTAARRAPRSAVRTSLISPAESMLPITICMASLGGLRTIESALTVIRQVLAGAVSLVFGAGTIKNKDVTGPVSAPIISIPRLLHSRRVARHGGGQIADGRQDPT